ncbi:MAG: hypothetical protein LUE27_04080 [Clostridia bacterium]|nr:hypothetical protein [Clostridia bacterium]
MSYRALAKKYGVSEYMARTVIKSDSEITQKIAHKKSENERDVLSYMDAKRDVVCEIIGKGLDVLNDEKKLASASPNQITTALGTLIDKWLLLNVPGTAGAGGQSPLADEIEAAYKKRTEGGAGDEC